MWKSGKLEVGWGFAAMLALALLAGAGEVLPLVGLSALCHELGHLGALRLAGAEVECFRLSAFGAEIQADTIAAPEDIDPNGMTLLQSGILRVDELEALAERYAENYTMLRILGQHAKAAADKAEDTDARWRLVNISRAADRDPGVVLQTWDGLLEACRVCSGRRLGEKHGDPSFVASISKTWERLTEATIESF